LQQEEHKVRLLPQRTQSHHLEEIMHSCRLGQPAGVLLGLQILAVVKYDHSQVALEFDLCG